MSTDQVRVGILGPEEGFETSLTRRPGVVLKKRTWGETFAVLVVIDGVEKDLHPDTIVRIR